MELIVRPRETVSRDEFVQREQPHAVALDGYVVNGPKSDLIKRVFNFDHHAEVVRGATRSTMGQVHLAVKTGLFNCLDYEKTRVFVNDFDQDVCLSYRLLKNYKKFEGKQSNPFLNRLIDIQDKLDVTNGLYPFNPSDTILRKAARIFAPYVDARMSGTLDTMDAHIMKNHIETISERITQYISGNGGVLDLAMDYDIVGGGPGWSMVREKGYYARLKLLDDNIRCFVSYKPLTDKTRKYSIVKASEFDNFPLEHFRVALNKAEGITSLGWNGGSTVIASHRERGSGLSPLVVQNVLNNVLENEAKQTPYHRVIY